jgi:uncharacterized NAD(P)/FAD-binding protein YdhS
MIDDTIETAKFGSALPAQRHVFGEFVRVPANPLLGRHPQTERTCKICGAVKVTVHPPDGGGYRMWRRSEQAGQVDDEPACEMQIDKAALLAP